jgi:cytochrome c biogenesis protein CcmG, thiol:disulfide interchange protein DsbE
VTARRQWTIVILVVFLLAVTLAALTHFLGNELFPIEVGSEAPPFQASTLDSVPRTRSLADYKGKVLLLNVWATWCEPCRVEMPSIEKLKRDFGPRGLEVVAISVDDASAKQLVRNFAKEYGLTFEILHDPAKSVSATYQITGYPETFIIGREGTIRKKAIGAADWNSEGNRALIRELLGSTSSAR